MPAGVAAGCWQRRRGKTMIEGIALACSLLASGIALAGELLECAYAGKKPGAEIASHAECARRSAGKMVILKQHLARMAYDAHRLASVRIEQQHYYVKPDGTLLPVLTHDNWADDFSAGLTRALVAGKIAYYDANFKQVIAPRYDWAWPFQNGRALVCRGCQPGPPDGDGHTQIVGGLWGYIDRKGIEVVPVRLPPSDAREKSW